MLIDTWRMDIKGSCEILGPTSNHHPSTRYSDSHTMDSDNASATSSNSSASRKHSVLMCGVRLKGGSKSAVTNY